MIAYVLIPLIGAGGAGLILLLGWLWRKRHVLATAILVAGALTGWALFPPPSSDTTKSSLAPVPPTIQVLSWGQQDGLHTDDTTGVVSPSHLVYATVAITAGDTAISVPGIFDLHPRYRVWLSMTDDGRTAEATRHTTSSDGSRVLLVPSHDDELVRRSGRQKEVLPIPGPECTDLQPGRRCEITLAWWIYGAGPILGVHGLTLMPAAADPTDLPSNTADVRYEPWPDIPAETRCSGAMEQWCY